jgi:hypothetical protein
MNQFVRFVYAKIRHFLTACNVGCHSFIHMNNMLVQKLSYVLHCNLIESTIVGNRNDKSHQ